VTAPRFKKWQEEYVEHLLQRDEDVVYHDLVFLADVYQIALDCTSAETRHGTSVFFGAPKAKYFIGESMGRR